jgi:hypothetical protein
VLVNSSFISPRNGGEGFNEDEEYIVLIKLKDVEEFDDVKTNNLKSMKIEIADYKYSIMDKGYYQHFLTRE